MIDYINEQNHKLAVRAKLDRTPLPNPAPGDYPWVGVFTGGTRLSTGLARAIQALPERGPHGQIVLVSDLRDEDLPPGRPCAINCAGTELRHRVAATPGRRRHPEGLLTSVAPRFIIAAADAAYAPAKERALPSKPSATPIVLAACALAALLALAEPLVPVRWSTRREARL